MSPVILVAIGGALGAVARYLIGEWLSTDEFPWGTLVVNLLGSLLLGILTGVLAAEIISQDAALLLGTGVLGAFTTMSAFSIETVKMSGGDNTAMLVYVLATIVLCPLLAALGWWQTQARVG